MSDKGQGTGEYAGPSDSQEYSPLLASLTCSGLVTILLFCLLPLSQFVRGDDWMVREVDWIDVPEPPRKKPVIEKKLEEELEKSPKPRDLLPPRPVLNLESLETSMEVGPGDFRTAFALTDYPFNSKLELRDATARREERDRSVIMLSVIPSQK